MGDQHTAQAIDHSPTNSIKNFSEEDIALRNQLTVSSSAAQADAVDDAGQPAMAPPVNEAYVNAHEIIHAPEFRQAYINSTRNDHGDDIDLSDLSSVPSDLSDRAEDRELAGISANKPTLPARRDQDGSPLFTLEDYEFDPAPDSFSPSAEASSHATSHLTLLTTVITQLRSASSTLLSPHQPRKVTSSVIGVELRKWRSQLERAKAQLERQERQRIQDINAAIDNDERKEATHQADLATLENDMAQKCGKVIYDNDTKHLKTIADLETRMKALEVENKGLKARMAGNDSDPSTARDGHLPSPLLTPVAPDAEEWDEEAQLQAALLMSLEVDGPSEDDEVEVGVVDGNRDGKTPSIATGGCKRKNHDSISSSTAGNTALLFKKRRVERRCSS